MTEDSSERPGFWKRVTSRFSKSEKVNPETPEERSARMRDEKLQRTAEKRAAGETYLVQLKTKFQTDLPAELLEKPSADLSSALTEDIQGLSDFERLGRGSFVPARTNYLQTMESQLVDLAKTREGNPDMFQEPQVTDFLTKTPTWRKFLEQELLVAYNRERQFVKQQAETPQGEEPPRRHYPSLEAANNSIHTATTIADFFAVLEQIEHTGLAQYYGTRGTMPHDLGVYVGPQGADAGSFIVNQYRRTLMRSPIRDGQTLRPHIIHRTVEKGYEERPPQLTMLDDKFEELYRTTTNDILHKPSQLNPPQ
ncbi:hypothetical protein HY468_06040 [Candidatus Roizmanbacteria bacterium]|nr:hypothetical protein [Candidatus Roizmanbacteria bacterium]